MLDFGKVNEVVFNVFFVLGRAHDHDPFDFRKVRKSLQTVKKDGCAIEVGKQLVVLTKALAGSTAKENSYVHDFYFRNF